MKVKDLIEILLKMNPEAEIITEPDDSMNLKEKYSFYEEEGWKKDIDEDENN